MRKTQILLLLAGLLWLPLAASAQITAAAKPADPNPAAKKVCETISMVTGVPISPLMGVGVVQEPVRLQAGDDVTTHRFGQCR
jgi:hypothetical protein